LAFVIDVEQLLQTKQSFEGGVCKGSDCLKSRDILANTPTLWIWQLSGLSKMHVDKYVLDKGFG